MEFDDLMVGQLRLVRSVVGVGGVSLDSNPNPRPA